MIKQYAAPTNLREAIAFFADKEKAFGYFVQMRWPNGVICPACEAEKPTFVKTRRIWQCRSCGRQFSVKIGTIFEDSAIGLEKWLPAMWLLVNCKNGISSYELSRALKVTQKTAWFMLGRIRAALHSAGLDQFSGEVEADETYVGGLAKFMHKGKRSKHERVIAGNRGMVGKTAVMGILERGKGKKLSRVRTAITKTVTRNKLHAHVNDNVEEGSKLYTDAHRGYKGLRERYIHEAVDHIYEYARGKVHTNGLENFWSLLKRSIKGTYVSVDPFHLSRYVDEQAWRFNNRHATDGERFMDVARAIIGKRLNWNDLTGRELATTPA